VDCPSTAQYVLEFCASKWQDIFTERWQV
jgi:hypothetical protein